MEFGPRQALGGIGGIHLFYDQCVLLLCDRHIQIADDDLLHIAGRRACESILLYGAIAPDTLLAKVQDVLGSLPERGAVPLVIDASEMGPLQRVVDGHQFLGAGGHGVGERPGLIAPDNGLDPGVHIPGIPAVPHIVHAQGVGFVRKSVG